MVILEWKQVDDYLSYPSSIKTLIYDYSVVYGWYETLCEFLVSEGHGITRIEIEKHN